MHRTVTLLLNIAHALDHLFLLIFATAVVAIAREFGMAGWEDLMPYGAGAFLLFGLGSLPAGKLGDQWGRRIYRAKGFTHDEAVQIAHRIFQDPEAALDMLVREELGLDPEQLGSAWGAAGGSFVAFAIGAVVPVVPYLFSEGSAALLLSLGLSLVALFAVGAAVSLLTGRSALFSGARQLGIGLAAALITYLIGSLIGVSIGVSIGG